MKSSLLYYKLIYGGVLAKKKRLFFSILGILIGVASLFVMVSVGESSKAKVDREFEEFGMNNLVVFAGKAGVRGGRSVVMEVMPTLKLDDVEALKNICGIKRIAPIYDIGSVVVEIGGRKITTRVVGTDSNYFAIKKYTVYTGRIFSDKEVSRGDLVAVIGWKVKDEVFLDSDPIGSMLRISRLPFRVIGVLEKKGTDMSGQDLDDVIVVPVTVATRRLDNVDYIKSIEVECENGKILPSVEKAI
ncbi:MAG: ABC transporter permease, partial [Thermosulfidibacteraceae bacterium]